MEHLDLEQLDALRAGEAVAAEVRAHLAWCGECRRELAALEHLAATLRRPARVPAETDAAILAMAAARAASLHPTRRRQRAAWAVAASALLAVASLLLLAPPRAPTPPAPASFRQAAGPAPDLDGDGRVTVLDAFALARAALRRTPAFGPADARQVDAVLAMAVALEQP